MVSPKQPCPSDAKMGLAGTMLKRRIWLPDSLVQAEEDMHSPAYKNGDAAQAQNICGHGEEAAEERQEGQSTE
jgi:hypothetical protein